MIFSVRQNTITAYGTIWEGNGMEFVSLFTQLEAQFKKIIVKLHTYGGSVFDGNLIYNALRNSKSDVDIHIVGVACSMGAVISLSRENVFMVENGFLMIHAPSGYTHGTVTDHESSIKLLKSIEGNFLKKLAKKTGKPESYVKKWLVGDHWFDANQAKDEGLISGIIEPETEIETFDPQQLGVKEVYNRYAALLLPESSTNSNSNSDNNMKKPIIEAFGLTGVSEQSSDTAVIEAVKKHYESQIEAANQKYEAEKSKRESLENKMAEQNKAAVTAVIEAAKKAGKITAEQVPTYEGIATSSGLEALKTVLDAIPARQPITGKIANSGGNNTTQVGRENWDFDKWQKEDPRGLEALSKEDPEAFQALYNQKYRK
jgi:ATP-dependent Clp protease protease subunit